MDFLNPMSGSVETPEPTRVIEGVTFLDFDDLIAPEPDANLIVPALGLGPGPVSGFWGQGYGGKTITAMSAGVSVATGKPLFGVYSCRRGVWAHFDHEQGRRHTKRRFVRLMVGMGLHPEEARGRARIAIYPRLNLTTKQAEDAYARLLDGVDFATIDALRGVTPGIDENSSEVRDYIDILGRVSERTGTTIVLIHHAGKTPAQGRPRKEAGRGSSAIYDAHSSVFVFSGEKGAPVLVTHEKDRELGYTLPDFGLRIEDVEVDDNPKAGLRVVHLEAEQMAGRSAKPGERFESLKLSIVRLVRDSSKSLTSMTAICDRIDGGNKSQKLAAIRELVDEGKLTQPGGEGRPFRVV